ncbi:DUF4255 domain-containing protein [Haliscomenobacter sp.]|uniref:DUF4255 domain-containing protein n=1 Tax=Haliscomenobacter sp. TaxID=2717303 RepID=UPI003364B5E6
MIAEAVAFLREELSRYVLVNQRPESPLRREDILLGNVAALETDTQNSLKNKVLISLVNLEEESTLKNGKSYIKNPLTNGIEYLQPPVYLNLYLLFSATLPDSAANDDYDRALHRLGLIIQFFQSKKLFTIKNSPQSPFAASEDEVLKDELRLLPELYTLTFEQINHLWGSLGGKQVPFAMYKVRLIKIQGRITTEAPLIEEIQKKSEELVAPKIAQSTRKPNADEDN